MMKPLLAGLALSLLGSSAGRDALPNVLVIMVDDMGYADLSLTGCTDFETPHIDRLGREGIFFTDGHVTASVCAPSRAGFMTGRYQQRDGFEANVPRGNQGLSGGAVTIAEALKPAGYVSTIIGKWHLGYKEKHPNAQGFDHFSGLIKGSRSYFPYPADKDMKERNIERDGKRIDESEFTYLTDWLTDEALKYISEDRGGKPYFMFLSYTAPHSPLEAPEDELAKHATITDKKRRIYAAMMTRLDSNVGRVLDLIDERNEAENTIIFFLSDNGGATDNHSDNGPWRGMKGSKWEGGQRIPLLVRWPAGGFEGGARNPTPTSSLDILPTLMAAAHLDSAPLKLDGRDMRSALAAGKAFDRELLWRREAAAAIRQDSWKMIRVTEKDGSRRFLLFDFADDPGETRNLSKEHPERCQQMNRVIETWEGGLLEPNWVNGEKWRENQRLKHRMSVVGREAERKLP